MDLVCTDDVSESLRVHAERWLARVYTEFELAECRRDPKRLGARFAAKEAALKVLRPARDEAIPWRAIEVRGGRLVLTGPAADRAAAAGLRDFALSLAHAGGHATAVVIADQPAPEVPPAPIPSVQASSWSPPQPMNNTVHEEIRRVIGDHARLAVDPANLTDDTDLYEAGMTSHASVNVMLALEDAFDLEFPDRMLKRDVFESVDRIAAAVAELQAS
jgi:phosphopantetheinyl transferase (holo-ACP synthase)/acyl carrier protein